MITIYLKSGREIQLTKEQLGEYLCKASESKIPLIEEMSKDHLYHDTLDIHDEDHQIEKIVFGKEDPDGGRLGRACAKINSFFGKKRTK